MTSWVVEAGLQEELYGIVIGKRAQGNAAEETLPPLRSQPGLDRRLSSDEHDPRIVAKGGDEDLAQPGVPEAENLVGVEGQDHPLPQAVDPDCCLFHGRKVVVDRAWDPTYCRQSQTLDLGDSMRRPLIG